MVPIERFGGHAASTAGSGIKNAWHSEVAAGLDWAAKRSFPKERRQTPDGILPPGKGDRNMSLWNKIKQSKVWQRLLNRRTAGEGERIVLSAMDPDRVRPTPETEPPAEVAAQHSDLKLDQEIDFSPVEDLETYTENLDVPEETIQRWISAGLLYPDEIRIAEQMVKIIRKKGELPKIA
jgi:hypothetical protein